MSVGNDLSKPFEPRKLAARIQAVPRRAYEGPRADDSACGMRIGSWRFDRIARHLMSPGEIVIALSNAEFRLLTTFIERPRRLLSLALLIDLTRAPGVQVNDRSIDVTVSRPRAKLGDSSGRPTLIRTVRSEDYLFDVEVQRWKKRLGGSHGWIRWAYACSCRCRSRL